jgi:putative tricarboxylic transport membrane protein
VGVYSTRNNLLDVAITAAFGVVGAVLLALEFPLSPIVLGFVLGPMLEDNFRRAMIISRGDLSVFATRPIAAGFVGASALLAAIQLFAWWRGRGRRRLLPNLSPPTGAGPAISE